MGSAWWNMDTGYYVKRLWQRFRFPPCRRSPAQLQASTILIVEDEPLVALHLHSVLREAGAGLIAATTADEALRLISRNDVSAAIVDVSLGGEDCLSVCK